MLASNSHATPVAVRLHRQAWPPLAIALMAPWTGILADVLGQEARQSTPRWFCLIVPTIWSGSPPRLLAIHILAVSCRASSCRRVFCRHVAYIADEFSPAEATGATGLYTGAGVFGRVFLSRLSHRGDGRVHRLARRLHRPRLDHARVGSRHGVALAAPNRTIARTSSFLVSTGQMFAAFRPTSACRERGA